MVERRDHHICPSCGAFVFKYKYQEEESVRGEGVPCTTWVNISYPCPLCREEIRISVPWNAHDFSVKKATS